MEPNGDRQLGRTVKNLLLLAPVLALLSGGASYWAAEKAVAGHVAEGPHREVLEIKSQLLMSNAKLETASQAAQVQRESIERALENNQKVLLQILERLPK